MALVVQAGTFLHQYATSWLALLQGKNENALKLGVLSTAQINPAAAIHPAETHPDVILYGIASRNIEDAEKARKSYKFKKAYGSYQALLDDPQIDIVYIATPNSLHFEWAYKALQAGKHVLLEKPFTSNAIEARKLVEEAQRSGKVLEEAFHWQFHPAAHTWRELLDSGKYGKIISTNARMTASPGVPHGDIRWQYDLAGGSFMDCTYALSFTRYALRTGKPKEVLNAVARPYERDHQVDAAMNTTLIFEDGRSHESVHSKVYTDLARSWIAGVVPRVWELPSIEVETEKATIYFYNAMMPHLYHYISITDKASGITTTMKRYSGGPLWKDRETTGGPGGRSTWSTYRYQLEAFVDKVRGKEPAAWVSNEESILQAETIDMVYEKSGLPLRPTSDLARMNGPVVIM